MPLNNVYTAEGVEMSKCSQDFMILSRTLVDDITLPDYLTKRQGDACLLCGELTHSWATCSEYKLGNPTEVPTSRSLIDRKSEIWESKTSTAQEVIITPASQTSSNWPVGIDKNRKTLLGVRLCFARGSASTKRQSRDRLAQGRDQFEDQSCDA